MMSNHDDRPGGSGLLLGAGAALLMVACCGPPNGSPSLLAYNEKQEPTDGTNVGGRSRVDRVLPRLRIVVLVPQGIEHGAGRAADVPGDPAVR